MLHTGSFQALLQHIGEATSLDLDEVGCIIVDIPVFVGVGLGFGFGQALLQHIAEATCLDLDEVGTCLRCCAFLCVLVCIIELFDLIWMR